MTTNTKTALSKEDKEKAVAAMRTFHAETMQKYTTQKAYFFPKVPYSGHNGVRVVGLFRSELERMGEDVFIELISMAYEPLDEQRTLYRHRFNPHFREEYQQAPGNTSERYSIPVDELEIVWTLPARQAKEVSVVVDSGEDANMSTMTIRDLTAILLRKPVSNKPWLNDLIEVR